QGYGQQGYTQYGYGPYGYGTGQNVSGRNASNQGLPANIGSVLAISVAGVSALSILVGFWNYNFFLGIGISLIVLAVLTFVPTLSAKVVVPVIVAWSAGVTADQLGDVIRRAVINNPYVPAVNTAGYAQLVLSVVITGVAIFWLLTVIGVLKVESASSGVRSSSVAAGQQPVPERAAPERAGAGQASPTGQSAAVSGAAHAAASAAPTYDPSSYAGYGQKPNANEQTGPSAAHTSGTSATASASSTAPTSSSAPTPSSTSATSSASATSSTSAPSVQSGAQSAETTALPSAYPSSSLHSSESDGSGAENATSVFPKSGPYGSE
ncbi:MAG: hypothetical protein QM673_08795, partial [Gordonia sp. (in: high G+C Gram-positive bacteria)]